MGSGHGRVLSADQLDRAGESAAKAATSIIISLPPVSSIDFSSDALFLDFDGTLAEIAPSPDQVAFFPETRILLQKLSASFSGAVAIVTGRRISEIDRHLAPLELPVAGLYGLVHRSADRRIYDLPAGDASIAHVSERLKTFVEANPGLLLELKGQTIALHYRARPELAAACLKAGMAALKTTRGLKLIEGKMVVEIAPAVADKGRAIRDFLLEAPFVGRRPIYCGDDVSDEAGFAVVNALAGITVKIGAGPSSAQYRTPHIAGLLDWLGKVSESGARA
ncbi:MAG: trehalose-phosphatase [Bacteroidota bacterium]|jgi:trehalose 6-phosphate phosphatase